MFLALLLLLFPSEVTVTIPMSATIRGTEVELGEVATVTGDDPELVARVKALELGYAPAPGYSRVLVAERVREKLYQKLPSIRTNVVGERTCRLLPSVATVSAQDIRATARKALTEGFGTEGTDFRLAREVAEVRVPAGAGAAKLVARVHASELASGLVSVSVDVLIDGIRYRTLWTTWNVEVFETRFVLTRPVKKGEQLTPAMFTPRRISVPAARRALPLDRTTVIGAVAKHDLRPGGVVTAIDVHRPTVVQIGEPLLLRVQKGSISAQVLVQALEAGSIGDRIRVRTGGTGREILATVRSRDFCELVLR